MEKDTTQSKLESQLDRIESYLFVLKSTFTFREACNYTGFSPSYLYKLTSLGRIPFSKPEGKKIYFVRTELDTWLQRNRTSGAARIEEQANSYMAKKGARK